MRKLLQINVSVNDGSNGTIAEEIGNLAQAKGWVSYIAYGRRAMESTSKLIKVGNRLDMYIHILFTRLFDLHGLCSTYHTKKLIKTIKKISPDIIHLHNIHGYFLNYKVLFEYLNNSGIPIVWTFHDCWPITGHCAHFISADCYKWKSECYDCICKKDYPSSYLLDLSGRNFKLKKSIFNQCENLTIVTVSKWLEKIVRESFLSHKRIQTIYNGLNMDVFKFTNSNLRKDLAIEDKFVLLGVASIWSEGKGLADYFKLAERLSDEFRIILIGLNNSQMASLPEKVIGVSRTDNITELVSYYSLADIVLNLSYMETFGLTTIEGAACGVPGIVYNATASPELVSDETGMIVEAGNIEQLIDAINVIKARGKSFYSENCINRVKQNFEKKLCYEHYLQIYDSLLK